MKSLERKIRNLEKQYEKVNPKAVLKRARIMYYFEKYTRRLEAIKSMLAPVDKPTRVVSWRENKEGKRISDKFEVCRDTSKPITPLTKGGQ